MHLEIDGKIRAQGPLLTAWRLLPRQLRQAVHSSMQVLRIDKVEPSPGSAVEPVIVVGALRAPTGLGQAARLAIQALREHGVAHAAIDLTSALLQPRTEPPTGAPPPAAGAGSLLVYATPPIARRALALIPKDIRRGKQRIAGWVCETEQLPALWAAEAKCFHRLTAPTNFAAAAIARSTGRPADVVGHPLGAPVDARREREGAFTIGAMMDATSSIDRKNLAGLVDCMIAIAARREDVHFLVSVRDGGAHPRAPAELARLAAATGPRLSSFVGSASYAESSRFFSQIDLFLSLSRAEGFGLPYAEAILHGVPVAAPRWGGPAEFLNDDNGVALPFMAVPINDGDGLYTAGMGLWADAEPRIAAETVIRFLESIPLNIRQSARSCELFETEFFVSALMRPKQNLTVQLIPASSR